MAETQNKTDNDAKTIKDTYRKRFTPLAVRERVGGKRKVID